MLLNELKAELKPGLKKRNNDYLVYHFSPVDISFSIHFDPTTEKVTQLKFFNYFY